MTNMLRSPTVASHPTICACRQTNANLPRWGENGYFSYFQWTGGSTVNNFKWPKKHQPLIQRSRQVCTPSYLGRIHRSRRSRGLQLERNIKFYFETTILFRQKCFGKVWPQKSEQLSVYGPSANLPIGLNWLHRRRCNKCSLVPSQEEDADAVGLRRETVNRWEKDRKEIMSDPELAVIS